VRSCAASELSDRDALGQLYMAETPVLGGEAV
jgi:hypothetical protein